MSEQAEPKRGNNPRSFPNPMPCGCPPYADGGTTRVVIHSDGTRTCRCGTRWELVWRKREP